MWPLILSLVFIARPGEDVLKRHDGKIGYEIEVGTLRITKLFPFLDFNAIAAEATFGSWRHPQTNLFGEHDLDDYLKNNSGAFEALPDAVKAQLMHGVIVSPFPAVTAPSLLLPGMKDFAKPSSAPLLSQAFSQVGKLHVPTSAIQDQVAERWKVLPFEEKLALVDANRLHPGLQLKIFLDYYQSIFGELDNEKNYVRDLETLHLRKFVRQGLAPKIETMIKNMEASPGSVLSQGYIEIRPHQPLTDLAQFFWEVRFLGALFGTDFIDRPGKDHDISFHYHLSVYNDETADEKFSIPRETFDALNDYLYCRAFLLGYREALKKMYYEEPYSKGLIRWVDRNWAELRFHPDTLEKTIPEQIEFLSGSMPVENVYTWIRQNMSEELLKYIGETYPQMVYRIYKNASTVEMKRLEKSRIRFSEFTGQVFGPTSLDVLFNGKTPMSRYLRKLVSQINPQIDSLSFVYPERVSGSTLNFLFGSKVRRFKAGREAAVRHATKITHEGGRSHLIRILTKLETETLVNLAREIPQRGDMAKLNSALVLEVGRRGALVQTNGHVEINACAEALAN